MPIRVLKKDKRRPGRSRDPYGQKKKNLPELETLELVTDDKLISLTKPKEMKRGGLTPGLKNYVKKEDSQEIMIPVVDKKSGKEIFAKKSEIMKNPGDYTPAESNLEKMLKPKNKKTGGLTGGRKKLDKNKDGKITGEDFKMMRKGYGAARTSGMGLQDEKVKPGKVMKAGIGAMMLAKKMKDEDKTMPIAGMGAKIKLDAMKKILGRSKGGGADMGTEMSDKRKKKFKQILARLKNPTTINIRSDYKPDTKSPMQRDRKREGYRAKVESMGGKVLFMDEMKKGGSVMARGCKLGRKKTTKLY